jgi:hypothetical protein
MNETLPVSSPLGGVLWTWVVPIVLFGIACTATWLLYRHFARRARGDDNSRRPH